MMVFKFWDQDIQRDDNAYMGQANFGFDVHILLNLNLSLKSSACIRSDYVCVSNFHGFDLRSRQ